MQRIYHLRWEDNRNDLRKTSLHLYGLGFIPLYGALYDIYYNVERGQPRYGYRLKEARPRE